MNQPALFSLSNLRLITALLWLAATGLPFLSAQGQAPAPAAPVAPVTPAPAAPAVEPEAPVPVDLNALAAGFYSQEKVEQFAAAEALRKCPPTQRRQLLLSLSGHANQQVRQNAWRAYQSFATKDDVPTFLAVWRDCPHQDVKQSALEQLPRFPGEQSLAALAKLLENPDERERAATLLIKAGGAAEATVLALATSASAEIRTAACEIAARIGGRRSLDVLKKLAEQPMYQQDADLRRVIETIQQKLRRAAAAQSPGK